MPSHDAQRMYQPDVLPYLCMTVCTSHPPAPPRAVFQPQLLDNQEGANTERCRLRKALGEYAPNAALFGTGTVPTVEYIDHGKSAQGCVIVWHTPSYTVYRGTPFETSRGGKNVEKESDDLITASAARSSMYVCASPGCLLRQGIQRPNRDGRREEISDTQRRQQQHHQHDAVRILLALGSPYLILIGACW